MIDLEARLFMIPVYRIIHKSDSRITTNNTAVIASKKRAATYVTQQVIARGAQPSQENDKICKNRAFDTNFGHQMRGFTQHSNKPSIHLGETIPGTQYLIRGPDAFIIVLPLGSIASFLTVG